MATTKTAKPTATASTAAKTTARKVIAVSTRAAAVKDKPRTPAFVAGECVIYPAHGVGQVVELTRDSFAGQSLDFLVVSFASDRMTLKIPVDKAVAAGLRKVSSDAVMKDAVATLKTKSRVRRTMWSRRAQEYSEKINSGNPVFIAEVVRDLYRPGGQAEQSFSERQIYEQALSRLAGEYAACTKSAPADAAAKLSGILAGATA
ncbi:hypothetical protein FACS1894186_0190 [Alphaproteobacteria bacterium]|nr:hypothetical protein FACS1894186_0190 [Alphaproteobacteria bacterium]